MKKMIKKVIDVYKRQGFRGQSIHYLHCGRNCRVDELWNSKGSETGKRAGQQ